MWLRMFPSATGVCVAAGMRPADPRVTGVFHEIQAFCAGSGALPVVALQARGVGDVTIGRS